MQEDDLGEVEFFGYSLFLGLCERGFRGERDLDDGDGVAGVAGGDEGVEGCEGELHFEFGQNLEVDDNIGFREL